MSCRLVRFVIVEHAVLYVETQMEALCASNIGGAFASSGIAGMGKASSPTTGAESTTASGEVVGELDITWVGTLGSVDAMERLGRGDVFLFLKTGLMLTKTSLRHLLRVESWSLKY